jgi:hypothetical protein
MFREDYCLPGCDAMHAPNIITTALEEPEAYVFSFYFTMKKKATDFSETLAPMY